MLLSEFGKLTKKAQGMALATSFMIRQVRVPLSRSMQVATSPAAGYPYHKTG